jgi:hypothetical protein
MLREPIRQVVSWRGSCLIPGSVAILLLVASALKAYQLTWTPLPETDLLTSKWFLIPIIEFEFVTAAALLLGILPRHTQKAAIVLFVVFLGTSLYQGAIGKWSCGCFGDVRISPWLTATIDAVTIVALICWRPSHAGKPVFNLARHQWIRRGMACVILLGSVALLGGALPRKPANIADDGLISGQGVVLLEPNKWLGRQMPLLPYVKTADDLTKGEWTVILIHWDCPKCQAVLPMYEDIARDWKERRLSSRIVVVIVPVRRAARSFEPIGQREGFCTLGHLSDEREWFVETPTLIKMVEGTVVEATTL